MQKSTQARRLGRPALVHLWRGPDGTEQRLTCQQVAELSGAKVGLVQIRAVNSRTDLPLPGGWRLVERGTPVAGYERRQGGPSA